MAAPIQAAVPAVHRFYPLHGSAPIEINPFQQCQQLLDGALERANGVLENRGVTVMFIKHANEKFPIQGIDPMRNLILGVRSKEVRGPIDIIDLKALDEVSLKPQELLADEIIAKVEQHFAAKRTNGILFTMSGCKLDTRRMHDYQILIDEQGYLRIDGHRIFVQTDIVSTPLKALKLRSYTILRFAMDSNDRIRLFDDYDLVRQNNKGMFIDPTALCYLSIETIPLEYQTDAAVYHGSYYELEIDEMGEDVKRRLSELLVEFPPP